MPHFSPETRLKRLVHKLEIYTKTDLTYLTSGGFWLSLDQVGGALIAFLLAIAFAHYVPKETYGAYRYLISAFWVLTAFTLTGLPMALSQAVARGREGVYRASFLPSILAGIPLTFISFGMSAYYLLHGNNSFGIAFVVIAILGPFLQPAYLFGPFLMGRKEFRTNSLFGLILYAIPALALFGTMFMTRDPVAFLAVYLVSNVGTGALLTFLTLYFWKPNEVPDPSMHNLSGHFSAMNLLSTVAAQIDKVVVFHYLGAVELAVYAFATALPEQINGVCNAVSNLAFPKFVARPFAEIRANFWNRLWLFTGALFLVALAYIAIAPFVFDLFFPAYKEAVIYSQVYAISLIALGNSLPITLLQARVAKRELYIYNVLGPTFQILILILLTSAYGLMGAVIARIASRIVSLALGGILLESYGRKVASI